MWLEADSAIRLFSTTRDDGARRPMPDQVEIFEPPDAEDARLRRLYQYWQAKCAGRLFPNRADLDPLDFPYILGLVTLVDVIDTRQPTSPPAAMLPDDQGMTAEASAMPPRRYYFRLDGSRLAEISGVDYTGRYLDQLPWPDYVDFVRWTYDEVLRKKRPLAYRRHGNIDEHPFDEETIILPLGAGQGRIEKLLVAVIPGQVGPAVDSVIL